MSTAIQQLLVGLASLWEIGIWRLEDWDNSSQHTTWLALARLGYPRHRPEFAKIQPKHGLGSLENPGFRAHAMHLSSRKTTTTRLSLQALPLSLDECYSSETLQSVVEYCF
ncbi:hypothetical protein RRF57_011614 [Xylaria bambusicola]|uniref:Uncharacterized protein n=1 Tax=Xylaria bambusicola TaxID=326684 RepID=A0AAN7ZA56_9PEZI